MVFTSFGVLFSHSFPLAVNASRHTYTHLTLFVRHWG
jgi:hypothetical protein